MRRRIRKLVPILLLVLSGSAHTEAVVVVEHWPPWEIAREPGGPVTQGVAVELARTIFGRMDVELIFRNAPWQRALTRIAKGSADIIPMISPTPERSRYMAFTDPVYTDELLLVTAAGRHAERRCQWRERDALRGKTIGMTRDYEYGPAWSRLMRERWLRIRRANNDLNHLKQALSGRVDLSLQYHSFLHSGLARTEVSRAEVRICSPAVEQAPLHFGISRKSPLARRVDEFNRVLETMKVDGTYREILGDLLRNP